MNRLITEKKAAWLYLQLWRFRGKVVDRGEGDGHWQEENRPNNKELARLVPLYAGLSWRLPIFVKMVIEDQTRPRRRSST